MLYRIRIRATKPGVIPQSKVISQETAIMACVYARRWLTRAQKSPFLGSKYDQWTVNVYLGNNRDGKLICVGNVDA